jgi:hypothetical protein
MDSLWVYSVAVRHFQRIVLEGKASEYAETSYSGGIKDTKINGKLAGCPLRTRLGKSADYEGKSAAAELVDLWVARASCSIRVFVGCEGSPRICYPSGLDPLSRTCVLAVAQFLDGFGAEESSHVMLSSCICT